MFTHSQSLCEIKKPVLFVISFNYGVHYFTKGRKTSYMHQLNLCEVIKLELHRNNKNGVLRSMYYGTI